MVSRSNLSGRPRPSGVLKTVQDGPTASGDDLAVAGGDVGGVTGPRRRQQTIRRYEQNGGAGGRYIVPDEPPEVGIDDPNPDVIEPPPVIQVPPSPPVGDMPLPGGSRRGGGAGYRARTGNIAREVTEEQERAGTAGRFFRVPRTAPLSALHHPMGIERYGTQPGEGPGGRAPPRWEGGAGGGGYGTDPGPRPVPPAVEPPPPPPPPPRPPRPPRDRDGRRSRGGPGPKQRR